MSQNFNQAHVVILFTGGNQAQVSSLIEHLKINNEILDCVSTYNLSMHHIDVK